MISQFFDECKYSIKNTPPLGCTISDMIVAIGIIIFIGYVIFGILENWGNKDDRK